MKYISEITKHFFFFFYLVPKPEDPNVCADESLKATPSSYYGSDNEGTCQTIVRVEPVGERCDSWRSRPALAHESMVKLEEKVSLVFFLYSFFILLSSKFVTTWVIWSGSYASRCF